MICICHGQLLSFPLLIFSDFLCYSNILVHFFLSVWLTSLLFHWACVGWTPNWWLFFIRFKFVFSCPSLLRTGSTQFCKNMRWLLFSSFHLRYRTIHMSIFTVHLHQLLLFLLLFFSSQLDYVDHKWYFLVLSWI